MYDPLRHFLGNDQYSEERRVFKKGKIHNTRSGPEVIRLAHRIKNLLSPYCYRIEIVGSIRRKNPNPVDVDLVAIPKSPAAQQQIKQMIKSRSTTIYGEGPTKISGRIEGVKVEVVFSTAQSYGAALLTYTGSFGHNIGLRRIAQQKGMLLNQYGLYKGKHFIAGQTEQSIYKALNRPKFKQPEERK
jgi:DNA polymerase (family X)